MRLIKKIFTNLIKFLIFISILALLFITAFFISKEVLERQFPEAEQENINIVDEDPQDDFVFYEDRLNGIRFAVFKLSPTIVYDQNQSKTVRDIGIENNFKILINGGFFNEQNIYAGALEINGEVITQPAPLDTQLSHIVRYNSLSRSFEFIETIDYQRDVSSDILFQTGPLFLLNNEIQTKFIDASINGNGEYIRSFVGQIETGEFVAGITTKRITLKELSTKMLELPIFKDKSLTLINLDGGSSSALFLGEGNAQNYGQFKILPVLIGFK